MVQIILSIIAIVLVYKTFKKLLSRANNPFKKIRWAGKNTTAAWFKSRRKNKKPARGKVVRGSVGINWFKIYVVWFFFAILFGAKLFYEVQKRVGFRTDTILVFALAFIIFGSPLLLRGLGPTLKLGTDFITNWIRPDDSSFGVWVGLSTGMFAKMNHASSIHRNQNIILRLNGPIPAKLSPGAKSKYCFEF